MINIYINVCIIVVYAIFKEVSLKLLILHKILVIRFLCNLELVVEFFQYSVNGSGTYIQDF